MSDVGILLLGVGLLLGGGESLVRGAARMAQQFGLSPLAVGLTIVALGTSAPELAVNIIASWRGSGALAFGNVVGSNLANIGLVVGVTALWRPLAVHASIVTREIPMVLLATAVAGVLACDVAFSDEATNVISRGDGIVLLLLCGVFVYYTANDLRRVPDADPFVDDVSERGRTEVSGRPLQNVLLIVVGVVALVAGAEATVRGGTGIARALGVSDVVIGLTVLAVGTSLPELASSLVAAFRGHTDLAVGNVVGSNILNLLLVMGAASATAPVTMPEGGAADLGAAGVVALLLLATAYNGREIKRWEGALLALVYTTYVGGRALVS